MLRRAWAVGAAAHAGQIAQVRRALHHPSGRGGDQVLAEQRLDVETLIAAILHDTIEDTPLTRGRHRRASSAKPWPSWSTASPSWTSCTSRDRQEAAAESFRKMLLAMSRDLRVILIKLADRLHNMRTLGAQVAEARGRIARETLEIYAPIAQRLGMNLVKAELQDLGFRALHPWRHAVLEKRIRTPAAGAPRGAGQDRGAVGAAAGQGRAGAPAGRPGQVAVEHLQQDARREQKLRPGHGRVRLPGGRRQRAASATTRWASVHSVFKPLDGRFRDFIAIPKANGYQSLHTVLFGPYGSPIEVQIRTEEMDLIAERGDRRALDLQARRRIRQQRPEPRARLDRAT